MIFSNWVFEKPFSLRNDSTELGFSGFFTRKSRVFAEKVEKLGREIKRERNMGSGFE
ncbi:hypothetical protein ACJIZ3_003216 [Penstemon smallii]|uniref:Uncharacterized protein n=1 Tax=Penstemon smallii TaxID=265156 RepID=A0ABD3UB82_9LAMI